MNESSRECVREKLWCERNKVREMRIVKFARQWRKRRRREHDECKEQKTEHVVLNKFT